METAVLNETVTLTLPDGFEQMSEEEMKGMQFTEPGPGMCYKDTERHIIVSFGWKDAGLASLLVSTKEIAKNMEPHLAKALKPYGYRLLDIVQDTFGTKNVSGVKYEYTAQDTPMYAESWGFKEGKTIFYIHYYTRKETEAENKAVWEEIRASLR
ncbi:MAG: hypothetical protein IKG46_14420 [Solobacterium sp.]|nr:hypothetical protein [Solobacterium sp.]